jgi:hypothetical protein
LNNVKSNLRDALLDYSQRFGGGMRDVDNASGNEWTAVIDSDRHGSSCGDGGHKHPCAERQSTVSGS